MAGVSLQQSQTLDCVVSGTAPTDQDEITHLNSLTTIRSCVGSIVRSAMENFSLCDSNGISTPSSSFSPGQSVDGSLNKRIEVG